MMQTTRYKNSEYTSHLKNQRITRLRFLALNSIFLSILTSGLSPPILRMHNRKDFPALADLDQWIEHRPMAWRVRGLIPVKGTCLVRRKKVISHLFPGGTAIYVQLGKESQIQWNDNENNFQHELVWVELLLTLQFKDPKPKPFLVLFPF